MKDIKIFLWSAINSIAAFLYIMGVAWIMFNGGKLFGNANNFWVPVALLLLFVLSATIVGILVLGRPIYFYLKGLKSEAVKLLALTIFCLLIITLMVFSTMLIVG